MFQVNFSNRAITELNKLGKMEQMELMEALGSVTPKRLAEDTADIGRFERDGGTLYRLRVDEWRVYFKTESERIVVQFLLHKRSIADFVVRFKLPVSDEAAIESHKSFRDYLDGLMK
jgi:mRNA-degrading endonuclease RelE of RelBE toxin-antitoxin system